jgi:hypothetical protein
VAKRLSGRLAACPGIAALRVPASSFRQAKELGEDTLRALCPSWRQPPSMTTARPSKIRYEADYDNFDAFL